MSSNAFFYGMYYNNDTPVEEQIVVPTRNFKIIWNVTQYIDP